MRKRNKEGDHSLMDLSLCANTEVGWLLKTKRGIMRHPASVLAPGAALGLLPSTALSSVQVGPHCNRLPWLIETVVDLNTHEGVEDLVPHVVSVGRF